MTIQELTHNYDAAFQEIDAASKGLVAAEVRLEKSRIAERSARNALAMTLGANMSVVVGDSVYTANQNGGITIGKLTTPAHWPIPAGARFDETPSKNATVLKEQTLEVKNRESEFSFKGFSIGDSITIVGLGGLYDGREGVIVSLQDNEAVVRMDGLAGREEIPYESLSKIED